MKKTSNSRTKKVVPVKEEQKISSFFKKLVIKRNNAKSPVTTNNKNESTLNSTEKFSKDDNFSNFNEINNKSSNEKQIKVNKIAKDKIEENDFDFQINNKKEKENNVTDLKIKPKLVFDKKSNEDSNNIQKDTDLETTDKENSLSPKTKSSELIIDLQTTSSKSPPKKTKELFSTTPEKTYLQRDDILLDITCSTIFQNNSIEKSNPIHSTPLESFKKRKFELDSPDFIPSTPQDICQKNIKSKLCIETKFEKPVNKKIKLSSECNEFSKVLQNSQLKSPISHSTSDFKVFPVNTLSPSKSSPQKGELVKYPISPSRSNLKIKKSLFVTNNFPEFNNSGQNLNKNDNLEDEKNILDDFFDDEWNGEINEIEDKFNELNLENWQYCKILEISKDFQQNLILKLQSIETKLETKCILQGVWQYSNLQKDDIINILAIKMSGEIPYFIDNNSGFLVFEPDIMISPTSIVGSQFCKRKGILSDKFRGFEPENKVMIVGTLVHLLLQDVLKKEIYKPVLIEKLLSDILSTKDIINTSYSSQIPVEEIRQELEIFVPKIVTFLDKYIRCDKNNQFSRKIKSEDWKGTINGIQDIEENIWCPQLGIKGKVDITVKSKFNNILPLELKTGRASMSLEHRGQVIMYLMMMSELGYKVQSGLLLYLREDVLREISLSHREKRDLLMLRNEFAYYVKQQPKITKTENSDKENCVKIYPESDPNRKITFAELPEPINHHNACKKCPYAITCTAILSQDNNCQLEEKHPLKILSGELLQHLSVKHIEYFLHWTSLLNLENSYKPPIKELKDIWRRAPYKREKLGKSICCLKISNRVTEEHNLFVHNFIRQTDEKTTKLLFDEALKTNFIVSGLTVGTYVVISTDTRPGVATGFIKNINENTATVTLDRDLTERYANKTFHLDTYESQQILNFSITSLATLIEPTDRAKRMRELIIDQDKSIITGQVAKSVMSVGKNILLKLNKIQQRAVLKSLSVKDYMLIKGMPGTGKTATIVALVQLLVKLKKTVLITSHTHSAVDNVCLRLLNNGVDIFRLGSENRIHPLLKHRSETALTAHCKTVEEMKEIYNSAQVVAVTCLGASHPMLNQRSLDICIVDESTQVLQCSVIKALLSSHSFILIGDPDQLPPVVRNPEALRRGMSESLFERLDNSESTVTLTLQYRMNKTITDLANFITYNGKLICADDNISSSTLNFSNLENLQSLCNKQKWLLDVLDSKLENSVIAIDTGPTWNISLGPTNYEDNLLSEIHLAPQSIREDEERKCCNNFEAAVAISIMKALKDAGISMNSIGVIAPYRAQVEFLKKLVSKFNENECCEVNTVDQYQGRDKDIIIYSCTRSRDITKPKMNSGFEILDDKRRLTVAITRAKYKLIIIGDFETLKEYAVFKKLLDCLHLYQKLRLEDGSNGFTWEKVISCLD